jgi:hypothetical protein
MAPQSCLRLLHSAWDLPASILPSAQPAASPACSCNLSVSRHLKTQSIFTITLAIVWILLGIGQKNLAAQTPIPQGQGWSQSSPFNGQYAGQYAPQYAPSQQSGYGQPAYAPQQPYAQQPGYAPQPSYAPQSGYAPEYDQQQPYPQSPYPDSGQQYPQQDDGQGQPPAQALNTEELEQLVAPIALYPDTLVAQVLAAATYPAQVVDADHWRQAQGYASPDQVVAGANVQSWDPSLKALTAFPQLLAEMDQNLRWTIALGNAYYNQPQDVLDVVQIMRQRAEAAGNLQSTPQQSVSYDQGYIQLAPVNPQVVYLPAYDPWTAYGQPIQPYRGFSLVGALGSFFGSSLGSSFGSGAVRFGLGIAMSAFNHTSFGWLGWGLNWLTHSLLFQNSNYYSHSTTVADWGLPHGGPRAAFQRGTMATRLPNNSYRSPGNYLRPGGVPNSYRAYNGYNRPSGQGYPGAADRYQPNRPAQSSYRGYPSPGAAYARPSMEAYNRIPPQASRPQAYSRPENGYGSGFYRAPSGGYATRPGNAYSAPQQAYRAPATGFQQRGDFAQRSTGSFEGRGFEGPSGKPKSGGFHLFGGSHEPKGFSSEKKFSSKHSDRGGHGGSKHHR